MGFNVADRIDAPVGDLMVAIAGYIERTRVSLLPRTAVVRNHGHFFADSFSIRTLRIDKFCYDFPPGLPASIRCFTSGIDD
ncbi:MAG TPA: hypothetical protein VN843_11360 [Anaerolineales bacterium]|nr:hypothetical protein [Anaerolineales bacterium]